MLESYQNRRRTESVTQVNCADNCKDKVITVSNAPKPTANTYWVLAPGPGTTLRVLHQLTLRGGFRGVRAKSTLKDVAKGNHQRPFWN